MRIVVAVDGSPIAARAVRYAAKLASQLAEPPAVTLIHADEPLLRSVAMELGVQGVAEYHAENARFATRSARSILHRAGIVFEEKNLVGDPASAIVNFCNKQKCDLLVMGSHGRTAMKSLFLGSVTVKVLSLTRVPVAVVR